MEHKIGCHDAVLEIRELNRGWSGFARRFKVLPIMKMNRRWCKLAQEAPWCHYIARLMVLDEDVTHLSVYA